MIALLPGLDGTGELFARFAAAAPPQFAVTPVRFPREGSSYDELADHVDRNLPPDERLVLIAESFSGPLAVRLAARRRMAALVLCNSFVVAPRSRALRWLVSPWFLRLPLPRFVVRRYMVGKESDAALAGDVSRVVASVPASVLAARLRSVFDLDEGDSFARGTVPTLYLRGTEDRLVPESASRRMAALRPMAIAKIPGPHLLLQVNPSGAWDAVTHFLESLPAE